MKKSELQQIIKEEIVNILKEGNKDYNENGVHLGYLELFKNGKNESKPSGEYSKKYIIKSQLSPIELKYIQTLKVFNQNDISVKRSNPNNTTKNYILSTPIGLIFIDTQGTNYPKYSKIIYAKTKFSR